MRPLIFDNDFGSDPVDQEILLQRLSKLNCFVMENEESRTIVSAETVSELSEVNVFECKMTQAAEHLLKEIKSDATLNDLISVVCKGNNFLESNNNIICNYDENNILHKYAFKDNEVTKINNIQLIIQLTYSAKKDIWHKFRLNENRLSQWIFIPKEEFIVEGLNEEIGVKAFGSIYISSNSELYKYIISIVNMFLKEDSDESTRLLEIFMSSVFNINILERVYKEPLSFDKMTKVIEDASHIRYNDESLSKMWSKIDANEFARIILSQNHTIYSINNWSRNENES